MQYFTNLTSGTRCAKTTGYLPVRCNPSFGNLLNNTNDTLPKINTDYELYHLKKEGVDGVVVGCCVAVLVGKLNICIPEKRAIPQKISIIITKTPTPTPIAFINALLSIS